jgi:GTP-binding protein HflX
LIMDGRKSPERAWLVWAQRKRRPLPGTPSRPDLLEELASLVSAAGAIVAGNRTQALSSVHPATLIGAGALADLRDTVRENEVDLVVFQNLLRPNQQANLERELNVKVLDRREIILDIFARRAHSREGKLQVELAQLSFRMGRLIGGRRDLSRLGGGIGTRTVAGSEPTFGRSNVPFRRFGGQERCITAGAGRWGFP